MDLLQEASTLLKERDSIVEDLRKKDDQLRQFCRKYEMATGLRGLTAIGLRTEVDFQFKKANQ